MKNDTTFVRSGDHLEDAKMSKKGTSLEYNLFIQSRFLLGIHC